MTRDRRVVFLDRDGVLVVPEERDGKAYAVRRATDLRIYPDAATALSRLKQAGFALVVVTNQPDVALGLLDPRELTVMHDRLQSEMPLDEIRVCPHRTGNFCDCRKPRPGLILANDRLGPVDFTTSWMIGDRDSDVASGRAAGCRTVFIDRGWQAESGKDADFVTDSLVAAADTILRHHPWTKEAHCDQYSAHQDFC